MTHQLGSVWTRALAALTLFVAVFSAQAHPGHSMRESNLSHLLSSPDHLLALGFTGLVLFAVGFCVAQPRRRKALQFSGVGLVTVALAIWGLAS